MTISITGLRNRNSSFELVSLILSTAKKLKRGIYRVENFLTGASEYVYTPQFSAYTSTCSFILKYWHTITNLSFRCLELEEIYDTCSELCA